MHRVFRTVFPEVTRRSMERKQCVCGRKFRRTIKVTNTVNPFNKDETGKVRTREEVTECVAAKMKEAISEFHATARCTACEESGEA